VGARFIGRLFTVNRPINRAPTGARTKVFRTKHERSIELSGLNVPLVFLARIFPIGLVVLLNGCAVLSTAPASVARPVQSESAPFALNGRISVRHMEARQSAGLRWTHLAQSDEILLLNPLGQTAARVYRDLNQATLDEGGKHYQNVDAESLMEEVLGWHLPLTGLHLWVLGLPAADSPAQIERDGNGRISVLRQDDWEVRYLRYADNQQNSLPARLQLSHEDLRVTLLIDEWEWNPQ
jgi:outer membrane lipoprotein LolB